VRVWLQPAPVIKTFTREFNANRALGGSGGTSWFAAPSEGRKDWLKLGNDRKMRRLACIRYRVGDPTNSFFLGLHRT
jgi:hypothetical protein